MRWMRHGAGVQHRSNTRDNVYWRSSAAIHSHRSHVVGGWKGVMRVSERRPSLGGAWLPTSSMHVRSGTAYLRHVSWQCTGWNSIHSCAAEKPRGTTLVWSG